METSTKQAVQVLTIEKVVKLLSPYHLDAFKKHLKAINAQLPLKLVSSITPIIDKFQGNEVLCKAVYGKADKQTRQSFNQLASYTLKLTSYLARNYPSYLAHNIDIAEILVSEGRVKDAFTLSDLLLDISEKIEDNKTAAAALTFLSAYYFRTNAVGESLRVQKRLSEVLLREHQLNEIILYFRSNINISVRDNDLAEDLERHVKYFTQFHNHSSFAISAMSRYYTMFIHYYYNPEYFYSENHLNTVIAFEEELNKYGYIVLPLFIDMHTRLTLFKLNNPHVDINNKDIKKEFDKLLKYNDHFHFWKYFSNIPILYAINIKATHFLANYHRYLHRPNPALHIPKDIANEVVDWTEKAAEVNKSTLWDKTNIIELIHLRLNYSALLLLGNAESRQKGIDLIEETLISYQQLSFSESIDSYFACLMIGYFSLKEYEKCVNTYKRYVKLTQGRKIHDDNDMSILSYYYASQWLLTNRKQYPEKLQTVYLASKRSDFYKNTRETIEDIVITFQIPCNITVDQPVG